MAQPLRILITDDSAHARQGLRALLATWSEFVVVGEATNGQEALQQVPLCRPDVILMDLHMPILDGMQATRLIKQRWPDIFVIALTMYSSEERAALAAGADAFVTKEGAPERLLNALGLGVSSTDS